MKNYRSVQCTEDGIGRLTQDAVNDVIQRRTIRQLVESEMGRIWKKDLVA